MEVDDYMPKPIIQHFPQWWFKTEAMIHTEQLAKDVVSKIRKHSEESGIPFLVLMTKFYTEFLKAGEIEKINVKPARGGK